MLLFTVLPASELVSLPLAPQTGNRLSVLRALAMTQRRTVSAHQLAIRQ